MAIPHRKLPNLTSQDIARFWAKVDKTPGYGPWGNCWEWTSSVLRGGHGMFKVKSQSFGAHRIAYLIQTGRDPKKLDVCHDCDHRVCCNGDHLVAKNQEANMQDMVRRGRQVKTMIGAAHWNAKLTDADVAAIRASTDKQIVIARKFHISREHVRLLRNNKSRASKQLVFAWNLPLGDIPKRCRVCHGRFLAGRAGIKHCGPACEAVANQSVADRRFWPNVDKTPGHGPWGNCWIWTGKRDPHDYGLFHVQGKRERAHRFAFIVTYGPFPPSKPWGLHRCDNPPCVRPDHIKAGTHEINVQDKMASGRQSHGQAHSERMKQAYRDHPERIKRGIESARSVLSEIIVQALRLSPLGQPEAAAICGVTQTLVGHIRRRTIWIHLPVLEQLRVPKPGNGCLPVFTPGEASKFQSRINIGASDQCWPWNDGVDKHGYGYFRYHRVAYMSHRMAFFLAYDTDPGKKLRRDCATVGCCNMAHYPTPAALPEYPNTPSLESLLPEIRTVDTQTIETVRCLLPQRLLNHIFRAQAPAGP